MEYTHTQNIIIYKFKLPIILHVLKKFKKKLKFHNLIIKIFLVTLPTRLIGAPGALHWRSSDGVVHGLPFFPMSIFA